MYICMYTCTKTDNPSSAFTAAKWLELSCRQSVVSTYRRKACVVFFLFRWHFPICEVIVKSPSEIKQMCVCFSHKNSSLVPNCRRRWVNGSCSRSRRGIHREAKGINIKI